MERFYTLNQYFKKKYNKKVFKISIDAGFTCPGICSYCSSWGSLASYARNLRIKKFLSLDERKNYIKNQVYKSLEYFKKKNIENLYIYFQAFSNLFDTYENIYEIYKYTLSLYNFLGLIIGTRPDTIDEKKIKIIKDLSNDLDLWIEFGLQSSNDNTLKLINRNHTSKDFTDAVNIIKKFDNIKIGTHIILGLPFETNEDYINTIKFLNKNNINGIKFHYLYILKDTQMEKFYNETKFHILNFEEYISSLANCIGYLNKDIVIFRLFSDPEPEEILPKYNIPKSKELNILYDYLEKHDIYQGKFV
jgi:hypothetical protein